MSDTIKTDAVGTDKGKVTLSTVRDTMDRTPAERGDNTTINASELPKLPVEITLPVKASAQEKALKALALLQINNRKTNEQAMVLIAEAVVLLSGGELPEYAPKPTLPRYGG